MVAGLDEHEDVSIVVVVECVLAAVDATQAEGRGSSGDGRSSREGLLQLSAARDG